MDVGRIIQTALISLESEQAAMLLYEATCVFMDSRVIARKLSRQGPSLTKKLLELLLEVETEYEQSRLLRFLIKPKNFMLILELSVFMQQRSRMNSLRYSLLLRQ